MTTPNLDETLTGGQRLAQEVLDFGAALDARNADLARERVGMFLEVTEGI